MYLGPLYYLFIIFVDDFGIFGGIYIFDFIVTLAKGLLGIFYLLDVTGLLVIFDLESD